MPRLRLHPGSLALAALLLALPVAAQQPSSGSSQQSSQSATQRKSARQKRQDAKKQDTTDKAAKNEPAPQQNAFPLAESEKAAQQAQQRDQKQSQQQNPPSAPTPQSKTGASGADRNPFPESESEKAARQAQQTQNAAPANQNSSSSAVPGLNLPVKPGHLPATPMQNPSLGRKDIKVGMFYLQSGDWKGAYDRFAEATQVDPESAEAVYGLAASAQHLGYREIAIRNYKLYLSAVPDGRYDKDCRKALKDLGVHP